MDPDLASLVAFLCHALDKSDAQRRALGENLVGNFVANFVGLVPYLFERGCDKDGLTKFPLAVARS